MGSVYWVVGVCLLDPLLLFGKGRLYLLLNFANERVFYVLMLGFSCGATGAGYYEYLIIPFGLCHGLTLHFFVL